MPEHRIKSTLAIFSESNSIMFDGERFVVPVSEKSILEKYSIPFDPHGHDLRIQFRTYFSGENLKYGKNIYSEIAPNDLKTSFLVLDGNGTLIKYNPSDESLEYFGTDNPKLVAQLKNLISYYKLFNFLKDQSFSDYFNDANNEIVIYSSINGIFKIKYDTVPVLSFSEDITEAVNKLLEVGKPVEISPFLKNAVFTLAKGGASVKLVEIITEADNVVAITLRDFELVSKKFDFDKFKDSLYKEKEKYFSNVREVINKIFTQAIGIPISISATVFSTYKVTGDNALVLIILAGFIVYVAFYVRIQLLYRSELLEIRRDFRRDFKIITDSSGLPKDVVDAETLKVSNKLQNSITILDWLLTTVSLLGLLVIGYSIFQIRNLDLTWLKIAVFLGLS